MLKMCLSSGSQGEQMTCFKITFLQFRESTEGVLECELGRVTLQERHGQALFFSALPGGSISLVSAGTTLGELLDYHLHYQMHDDYQFKKQDGALKTTRGSSSYPIRKASKRLGDSSKVIELSCAHCSCWCSLFTLSQREGALTCPHLTQGLMHRGAWQISVE